MKRYKSIVIAAIIIATIINIGCDNNTNKEKNSMPKYLKTQAKDQSENGVLTNYLVNMNIDGKVGDLLTSHREAWLQKILVDNPGLFEGFLDPTNNTIGKTMWHGEFPGKILTGIAQMYITNRDQEVLEVGNKFVEYFKQAQQEDGYLGPWPDNVKFNKDSVSATEGALGKMGHLGTLPLHIWSI